ncbi:hypothetical protein PHYBOEH_011862 [Phytophthora boehmeriae]|uniref:Uncharacterized protein n=1 Tax=Phytophthora boehmeriae TaxID=109152 RepID=A0A8T1X2V6_9STRA|nr:hypothetical protein PHYBOEH_011862 [Phytophthora boehmeriae]
MAEPTKTTDTKGKVIFSSQRNAVFCFVVNSDKIWLEQQDTKKQWECIVSSANDFALKGAGIPHAIVMDYLAMSFGCISEGHKGTNSEVDLIEMSDNRLRLDFSLKFAISGVVWKPEYQFVLQPLEVSETQVLEAKLVDAEEHLERLHAIVPAWALGGDDRIVPRNQTALQFAALSGAKLWFYVCGLAKWTLERSGTSVDTAIEWIEITFYKATALAAVSWYAVWGSVKRAGGAVRNLVEDKIAGKGGYYPSH